jgi:hypothetical protein
MSDLEKIQALENFITNPDSKDLDKYLSPSQKVEIQSIKIPSNSSNILNKM